MPKKPKLTATEKINKMVAKADELGMWYPTRQFAIQENPKYRLLVKSSGIVKSYKQYVSDIKKSNVTYQTKYEKENKKFVPRDIPTQEQYDQLTQSILETSIERGFKSTRSLISKANSNAMRDIEWVLHNYSDFSEERIEIIKNRAKRNLGMPQIRELIRFAREKYGKDWYTYIEGVLLNKVLLDSDYSDDFD